VSRVLLLLPSATYKAKDFLHAARALGIDVVVGCDETPALGELMGTRALRLPFDDPDAAAEAIVLHDSATPLDAIVAVDDQGVVAAAAASERLGLRHNPPGAAAATRDKLVMRALLAKEEVSQPAFATLPDGATTEDLAAIADAVGLPCVVKPTTLSASQGVLRADSPEALADVARRVRRIATSAGVDPRSSLLVERFIPGDEVAVEGLLRDGDLEVLAIFDKPDPLEGPAFEETIYVTPTRLDDEDSRAVVDATRKAAEALGLREGPVHAELRIHRGRAWVIEVAARTIGGLCSRALTFSTGRSLEELVLAHAAGIALGPVEREERASGVLMIPIPRAGRLVAVDGIAEALHVQGVIDVQVTIAPGREVLPVPEGNRYLGFVFARAQRADQVEASLRTARSLIQVHIED